MTEITREIARIDKELQYYNSLLHRPGQDKTLIGNEIDYRLQLLEQLARMHDQSLMDKQPKQGLLNRIVSFLF